jgi:hypothetical protein
MKAAISTKAWLFVIAQWCGKFVWCVAFFCGL